MVRFVRAIWPASLVIPQVPSAPPNTAPIFPEVVEVWDQATSAVPFHQTVLAAVVSQLPLAGVTPPFPTGSQTSCVAVALPAARAKQARAMIERGEGSRIML